MKGLWIAMRIKKLFSGFLAMVLCFAMLLVCSVSALAAGTIDLTKKCSLTLNYVKGGVALQYAEVSLYRVGDINGYGEFKLADSFKDYSMNLKDLTASEWKSVAETLAGYVVADKPEPLRTDETDEKGKVVFSALYTGLYLVMTKPVTVDGHVYTTEDFLISLPEMSADDYYVYEVTAKPKIAVDQPTGDEIELTVVKKWADVGHESNRPTKVTVSIYRGETLYQTQELSSENNWTYKWKIPNDGSTWKVVEKDVPSNYKATISLNGSIFTVTNTYTKPGNPNLPQTGQLWWPVMALAGGGIVIFTAGWLMSRKKKNRSEAE